MNTVDRVDRVDRINRTNELLTIICITSCITMILTSAACFVIVASLMK